MSGTDSKKEGEGADPNHEEARRIFDKIVVETMQEYCREGKEEIMKRVQIKISEVISETKLP